MARRRRTNKKRGSSRRAKGASDQSRAGPTTPSAESNEPLSPKAIEVRRRAQRIAVVRERRRRSEQFDLEMKAWGPSKGDTGGGTRAGGPGRGGGGPRRGGDAGGGGAGGRGTAMAATRAPGGGGPPMRILAEGDSWFDFPFGGKPFRQGDVIERLRDLIPFPILNLALRGDESRYMLGVEERTILREHLEDSDRDFNVLLFSGGGNDIVGNPYRLWLRDRAAAGGDPSRAINEDAFGGILRVVRTAYENLLDLRDEVVSATPGRTISVFFHGYDWAIPSGQGVCGFGPWLKPSLSDRGWDDRAEARAIVKESLSRFAAMLEDVARQYSEVVVVGTQGTLADDEWHDELHPNQHGFPKIATGFRDALRARFPQNVP